MNKKNALVSERKLDFDESMSFCLGNLQDIVLRSICEYHQFSEEGRIALLKNFPPETHKYFIGAELLLNKITQATFSQSCKTLDIDFELKVKHEPQHPSPHHDYIDFVVTSEGVINLLQVTRITPSNYRGLCEIHFTDGQSIELPQKEYQYLEQILEPFQLSFE